MNTTMARIKDTMDVLEESIGLPAGSKPGGEILIIDPGTGGGYHVGVGTCVPGLNVCGDSLYTEDKVNPDTYYDDFFKQDGTNPLVLHEFGHGYCLEDFPNMGEQWTAETVSSYIRYTKGRFEKHYDLVHSGMVKKDLDFWLLERMVGFSMYSGGEPCGEVNFNSKQFKTGAYELCWKWLNWFPQKAHGWKIWKDVNTLGAKSTKHYSTRTDRMVDLYCQATKHNMLPMFNFFNIQPSDESITNSCQKLPESKLITRWINVAKCVRQSITDGNKDIRECGKMPRFPEHKGLCVISGVCNMDETNNGETSTMNKKFDLYGSTGKRLNFADKNFPKTSTSVKKETCFKRAQDFFQGCKNNLGHPITATFYGKEQGKELSYKESSFTFPTTDICEENLCSSKEGCPLAKNTMLAVLPELKMEFNVSFEFRGTAWASGWNPQSVIHFTEGGDCCNAGQRVPALWVSNSGRLYPCFAIGDNGNYCTFVATKAYTLKTWHSVEFSQTLKNGKYMYRVVVDREDIFAPIENTKPRIFSNVKVYAGDNWYNPVEGSIRNLRVNPQGDSTSWPQENGFCVLPNGLDQNAGVIKLDDIDGNIAGQKEKCLQKCLSYPGAST